MTAGSATEHPLEVSGTFSEDVVVERVAEGRYRAYLDHCWDLFPLPQGGVVVSFGLRAATAEVAAAGASAGAGDPAQELRTCTSVFAGQVASGALEIDVTVLRRGRSATQVSTVSSSGPENADRLVEIVDAGGQDQMLAASQCIINFVHVISRLRDEEVGDRDRRTGCGSVSPSNSRGISL